MFKVITNTYSGMIVIYNHIITKIYRPEVIRAGCMGRELKWLTTMADFDGVPNVVNYGDNFIKMTYVGERVTKATIPDDWKDQIEWILEVLFEYNCSHNDIKPEEILVLDGDLYLIDFGWALPIGDPVPKSWPRAIGDQYRFGIHNFDDGYSFNESIQEILK